MLAIFLKTLPFFGLIGLGYWAGRTRFFSEEATVYLTKFVFYFALSAMLFRFAANLSVAEVFSWPFVMAYLWGTAFVYLLATAVAFLRRISVEEAAVEAQCAVIGNVGFLGIPMLFLLLGEDAAGFVMLVLAIDLIVFGSLIVILITGSRDGRLSWGILQTVGTGLLKNPMIVSISLGLFWSAAELPIPAPMNEFLAILGAIYRLPTEAEWELACRGGGDRDQSVVTDGFWHEGNSGGVIVSYFEWVQDLQSLFWTRDEVLAKMYKILDRAKAEIEAQKRKLNCSRREAVLTLEISKVAEAKRVRGLFP